MACLNLSYYSKITLVKLNEISRENYISSFIYLVTKFLLYARLIDMQYAIKRKVTASIKSSLQFFLLLLYVTRCPFKRHLHLQRFPKLSIANFSFSISDILHGRNISKNLTRCIKFFDCKLSYAKYFIVSMC